MSVVLPDKRGPWTVDDLFDFPESHARIELVDGALVVTPPPSAGHQVALSRLSPMLQTQLGDEFAVLENLGIDMGTSLRIPDLVVLRAAEIDLRRDRLDPSAVLLAVEVVSPSSVSQDRLVKPTQYAAAGIPALWRVETTPKITLNTYGLRGDVYAELGAWSGSATAEITEPFAVSVDLGRLTLVQ